MSSSIAPEKPSKRSGNNKQLHEFIAHIAAKNPGEKEFIQAVKEVAETVFPFEQAHARYREGRILERMCEPERIIIFRVPWMDDKGHVHINRGYRVQMNSAIGPYKGGLRFHPSVNLSIFKFLAFEQIFKNSLTTLPMGAGKGGADFDPKGKSDREVMNFCQSFMTELHKYIGPDMDVPAGDIGVGNREIGYLFGQYKRLSNWFGGAITGKGLSYGGSLIRPEATGFGSVYFANEMLATQNDSIRGKICVVSGAGNVAQFAIQKVMHLGGKVVAFSDSDGTVYDKAGVNAGKFQYLLKLKNEKRGRVQAYADQFGVQYMPGKTPWGISCDVALPCATHNELKEKDARELVTHGCKVVSEGANMPCTPDAIRVFNENKVRFGPGKAANAGGVAVSGLEMRQNITRTRWSREKVDNSLRDIMKKIHAQCALYGKKEDDAYIDYLKGANIGGYVKVADAMLAHGVV